MPLTLATFNVKDLFDAAPGDAAARAHLDAKLEWLARMVRRIDADVLTLQEVGSAGVLRELCARLPRGGGYGEPLVGTADARGIRCALLSRLPLLEGSVRTADRLEFPVFAVGDPSPFGSRIPLRRGVVHARVDGGTLGPFDVLVAHFKSNRPVPLKDARGETIAPTTARAFAEGHLRSMVWRAAEALFVRGVVDELLESDPDRQVVVAGDLNDHASSLVVRSVIGGGPRALVACAERVPERARFSILRHGAPQQIDHLLVTPRLAAHVTSAVFLNEELRDHSDFEEDAARSASAPALTQPVAPPDDSDHAPFVVSFA